VRIPQTGRWNGHRQHKKFIVTLGSYESTGENDGEAALKKKRIYARLISGFFSMKISGRNLDWGETESKRSQGQKNCKRENFFMEANYNLPIVNQEEGNCFDKFKEGESLEKKIF